MVASTRVTPGEATGLLSVLSCPSPLCPHLEFAVATVLESPVNLSWSAQPSLPGTLQARLEWRAAWGTAGRLAARLKSLGPVRFEVVETPSPGVDAERYSFTPTLGLFRASLAANGDIAIGEGQLRALLAEARTPSEIAHGVERLLGAAWDEDLEPLRLAGDGAPVTWLPRTG